MSNRRLIVTLCCHYISGNILASCTLYKCALKRLMFQKELLLIQIVHIIPVLETLAIPRELKQKQHDILLKKTFDGALKQMLPVFISLLRFTYQVNIN